MAASRKHNDINQRISDKQERKEMKEENQRLINLQNRTKSRVKAPRRVVFGLGDMFDTVAMSGYPA